MIRVAGIPMTAPAAAAAVRVAAIPQEGLRRVRAAARAPDHPVGARDRQGVALDRPVAAQVEVPGRRPDLPVERQDRAAARASKAAARAAPVAKVAPGAKVALAGRAVRAVSPVRALSQAPAARRVVAPLVPAPNRVQTAPAQEPEARLQLARLEGPRLRAVVDKMVTRAPARPAAGRAERERVLRRLAALRVARAAPAAKRTRMAVRGRVRACPVKRRQKRSGRRPRAARWTSRSVISTRRSAKSVSASPRSATHRPRASTVRRASRAPAAAATAALRVTMEARASRAVAKEICTRPAALRVRVAHRARVVRVPAQAAA